MHGADYESMVHCIVLHVLATAGAVDGARQLLQEVLNVIHRLELELKNINIHRNVYSLPI